MEVDIELPISVYWWKPLTELTIYFSYFVLAQILECIHFNYEKSELLQLRIMLYTCNPSRRVVTSTWWEGLIIPMIPRVMPEGALAPGRATQASKVKDEGRS
jgi:hypothetical protein